MGLRVSDLGVDRIQGLGFRIQSAGFRIQGSDGEHVSWPLSATLLDSQPELLS